MRHYYTKNDDLQSKRQQFSYVYHQKEIRFSTDAGVFSKKYIDFGSRVLIENVDVASGQTILDVGCGYGAIGISLAKVYGLEKVDMVDVNDRAILLAAENARLNEVDVRTFLSDVYSNVEDKYDVIVTNPPIRAGKKVVLNIVEGSYDHLEDGGVLYVVIQKKQGAPSILEAIRGKFGNGEVVTRDKGYFLLKAVRSD